MPQKELGISLGNETAGSAALLGVRPSVHAGNVFPGQAGDLFEAAERSDYGVCWVKSLVAHRLDYCDNRYRSSSDNSELRNGVFRGIRDYRCMSDPQEHLKRWLGAKLEPFGVASELARHLGVEPTAVSRMKELDSTDPKKRRQIKPHEIPKIAAFFKELPPGYEGMTVWLGRPAAYTHFDPDAEYSTTPDADGEGYDRENYEPQVPGAIPELDAKAGAGEGAVGEVMVLPMGGGTKSGHKITGEWLIPPEYLREAVSNPERAIVLGIQGDSMMPNYAPGDRVIIDLSEHELRADGVYLISDGVNAPQIKRLQIVPFTLPPKCRIISDNPLYQPIEVETGLLHIMGKVSAYIGRR